jgi:hypothetical protein
VTHGCDTQIGRTPATRAWFAGVVRPVLLTLVLGFAGSLSACRQPPLRASDPRSQFDHYDLTRNEHEPAYWFDEYGRRQPNLKGRLLNDR